MNALKDILVAYQNGERGLPLYHELAAIVESSESAPEAYELDDPDLALMEKCRKAVEYDDNGDPMRDVMDIDDFHDAVRLLVAIVDANIKESQP